MYKIYGIELENDNTFYVGLTKRDVSERVREHLTDGDGLSKAMEDGFKHRTLDTVSSESKARTLEQEWIHKGFNGQLFYDSNLRKAGRLANPRRTYNKQNVK